MKIKPTQRSGGVVVELGPAEAQLPGTSESSAPLFQLNKVLVPVDFSDCSKKALQYALPLAKEFSASLVLLYVVEPYFPIAEAAAADIGLIQAQMQEAGHAELAKLRQGVEKEVVTETALRVGRPDFEIVRFAKENEIDLIILSTHGRTGLGHVFLGSTAERVVRHAGCPVLVVREREHEFVKTLATTAAGGQRPEPVIKG